MTLLSDLQALAEKWHQTSNGDGDEFAMGYGNARDDCADELTELLGKMVVDEAMVTTLLLSIPSIEKFEHDDDEWNADKSALRAALESAIGVTKHG